MFTRLIVALLASIVIAIGATPVAHGDTGISTSCANGVTDYTWSQLVSAPEVRDAVEAFQTTTRSQLFIVVVDEIPAGYVDNSYLESLRACKLPNWPAPEWGDIAPNSMYLLFDHSFYVEEWFNYDGRLDIDVVANAYDKWLATSTNGKLGENLIHFLDTIQPSVKKAANAKLLAQPVTR